MLLFFVRKIVVDACGHTVNNHARRDHHHQYGYERPHKYDYHHYQYDYHHHQYDYHHHHHRRWFVAFVYTKQICLMFSRFWPNPNFDPQPDVPCPNP